VTVWVLPETLRASPDLLRIRRYCCLDFRCRKYCSAADRPETQAWLKPWFSPTCAAHWAKPFANQSSVNVWRCNKCCFARQWWNAISGNLSNNRFLKARWYLLLKRASFWSVGNAITKTSCLINGLGKRVRQSWIRPGIAGLFSYTGRCRRFWGWMSMLMALH